MRSFLAVLACVLVASPALARDAAPYYGPKQGLMGEGYKHSVVKDGSWRIVTEYHTNDPMVALDVALYRAADLARLDGHRYVQVLSGDAMASYGVASGFVFAKASDSPEAPAACRAKRCYTADVAKVLDALSGPSGNQPGVAKPSSVDERGRQVTILGFGIGAIAWREQR